jgi:hypothetical protein
MLGPLCDLRSIYVAPPVLPCPSFVAYPRVTLRQAQTLSHRTYEVGVRQTRRHNVERQKFRVMGFHFQG